MDDARNPAAILAAICTVPILLFRRLFSLGAGRRHAPDIDSVFGDLRPRMINEEVYEIGTSVINPSLELVFFHGFEEGDYKDAYWKDWLSTDGSGKSHCWLQTWLSEDFPAARVLSVSYDSTVRQTSRTGRMDMYQIVENLEKSLIHNAQVGQQGCPVILVGHSLGGLVMKALCVRAQRTYSDLGQSQGRIPLGNFLGNVKGLFFYATPHHGLILSENDRKSLSGPVKEDLILGEESARLNQDFHAFLSAHPAVNTRGSGEAWETSPAQGQLRGVLAPEGTARSSIYGVHYTISADHSGVCKPACRASMAYRFLTHFVEEVLENSCRMDNLQNLPRYVLDLNVRMERVKDLLRYNARVAIIGMGGIGKSTLAKKLFNDIYNDYEYTCFVNDIKRYLQKDASPEELQHRILGSLHQHGRMVNSSTTQWRDLKGKTILLVLDDADSSNHVLDLDHFSADSRLVVTSRNKGFLKDFAINDVELLDQKSSKELLCRHAFKGKMRLVPADAKFQELLEEIARKCAGLPLTLEVVGSCLYKEEDRRVWEETLGKLERAESFDGSNDDRLWETLRISYDRLAPVEKEIFLDVAVLSDIYADGIGLFGPRRIFTCVLSDLKLYWDARWKSSATPWRNLVNRCLVSEYAVPTSHQVIPRVHESLRDLGRRIACPPLQPPESHSRICFANVNDTGVLVNPRRKGNWKAKMLVSNNMALVYRLLNIPVELDTGMFLKFPDLQFLWLEGNFMYGTGLLQRREHFPRESQMQILAGLPSSLQHLYLHNLDELTTLPESLGGLTSLQDLHLSDLRSLTTLPESLGGLTSLQHLHLSNLRSLTTLPESLGGLTSLQHLHLSDLVELTTLPQSLGGLTSLQHLHLSDLVELTTLPQSLGGLTSLQHLHLSVLVELTTLPKSLGGLTSLQHLHLSNLVELTTLPESLGGLTSLQHLHLSDLRSLMMLPEFLGGLTSLQHLHLSDLRSLMMLPESLGGLTSLQHLHLSDLWSLTKLPESVGRLTSLEQLHLSHLNKLTRLPESLEKLTSLQQVRRIDIFGATSPIPPEQIDEASRVS